MQVPSHFFVTINQIPADATHKADPEKDKPKQTRVPGDQVRGKRKA